MNDSHPITLTAKSALPHYETEALAALSAQALVNRLIQDEDRAPRNLIDECASRGDTIIDALREALVSGRAWADESGSGEWWLLLHAVMILGLMPDERAGLLIVQHMRRIGEEEDDDMQDWLGGYWPALFRNKPDTVLPALHALAVERTFDWFARTDAIEAILAYTEKTNPPTLDATLDWAAQIVADDTEHWEVRCSAASGLLTFAPAQHCALLEGFARSQAPLDCYYSVQDAVDTYSGKRYEPQWERFDNPWDFYEPATIEKRLQQWLKQENESDDESDDDDYGPTRPQQFVREHPKVGRNDPCPCGSGKKYKKCCIDADLNGPTLSP